MSDSKKASTSGSAPSGPDMELKKAFAELQAKAGETKRRLKIIDMQVENERRSITHAELTEAEVRAMPQGTRMYNSVGRMFVLAPVETVTGNLSNKRGKCQEKIRNLQANKEYLEKSIKESEDSLRELILAKKNTAA